MKDDFESMSENASSHLATAHSEEERADVALTWFGYLKSARITGGAYEQMLNHLRVWDFKSRPTINRADEWGEEELEREWDRIEREHSRQELSEGRDRHPKNFFSFVAPIQADLRGFPSADERRQLALQWSGYVVGLAQAEAIPPGHGTRLMAELAPWLRPGDPWEAIAADAGVALDPSEEAAATQQGGAMGFPDRIAERIGEAANEDRGPSGRVIVDMSTQQGLTEAVAARGAARAFALDAEAMARGERPSGPLRRLRVIGPDIDVTHDNPAVERA